MILYKIFELILHIVMLIHSDSAIEQRRIII